jgi:thiamine-phosphate pyrophosphorylase
LSLPSRLETLPKLYPILDASFKAAWPASSAVEALGRAGCRLVQLRAKELTAGAFHDWASEAVQAARRVGIVALVNDRVDVAMTSGAGGVHLGQDDLSVTSARRVLGETAIIGLSTHMMEQATEAERLPVDYVAIGPAFRTATKQSANRPLGPEGIARVRGVVRKPLVAIGGITLDNGGSLLRAGADSLAVISALMRSSDLEAAAREMLEAWRSMGGVR